MGFKKIAICKHFCVFHEIHQTKQVNHDVCGFTFPKFFRKFSENSENSWKILRNFKKKHEKVKSSILRQKNDFFWSKICSCLRDDLIILFSDHVLMFEILLIVYILNPYFQYFLIILSLIFLLNYLTTTRSTTWSTTTKRNKRNSNIKCRMLQFVNIKFHFQSQHFQKFCSQFFF